MDLWMWVAIGIAVFILLAILTKGKILEIIPDVIDAFT